jgi:hypothetical protein
MRASEAVLAGAGARPKCDGHSAKRGRSLGPEPCGEGGGCVVAPVVAEVVLCECILVLPLELFQAEDSLAPGLGINQHDTIEKQHQIRLMREIYVGAAEVIMWVGEESEHDKDVLPLINKWASVTRLALFECCVQKKPEKDAIVEAILRHASEDDEGPSFILDDDNDNREAIIKIHAFLLREYWQRVWILQEAVLARRGLILCGDEKGTLIDLWFAVSGLQAISTDMRAPSSSLLVARALKSPALEIAVDNDLASFRGLSDADTEFAFGRGDGFSVLSFLRLLLGQNDEPTGKKVGMFEVLLRTQELRATDPRDKVFGLVGVTEDGADLVEVNYKLTVAEVYSSLVAAEIRASNSLYPVVWAGEGFETQELRKELDLPSWVPDFDWTRLSNYSPRTRIEHRACGETKPEFSVSADYRVLTLKGVMCDRVEGGKVLPKGQFQVTKRPWLCAAITMARLTQYPNRPLRPQGVPWLQILFRNMARTGESFVDNSEALSMAKAFIQILYEGAVKNALSSPQAQASIETFSRSWTHGEQARKLIICLSVLGDFNLAGRVSDVFKKMYGGSPPPAEDIRSDDDGFGHHWLRSGLHAIHYGNPTFFFTQGGYMGFGPHRTCDRDKIFLPFGCPTPLVVRPSEKADGKFSLVGYCYIYGMMEGEIMRELAQGERESGEINLI